MINAHRTGAFISSLRKAKDWTQLDLAQKLLVTHQAVSQWEKGASFPDVGLLPQLARLFGVSVDDLLNGEPVARTGRVTRGAIVEELTRENPGEVARLVKRDPAGVEAMLAAAPLARPSQMDAVVANLAGYAFTLPQVIELAPFVGQSVLQSLLDNAGLEQIDGESLVELAPFIGEESLDGLVRRTVAGTLDFEALKGLAPHLGQKTLTDLVYRLLEAGQKLERHHLEDMAPFLDTATLDDLLQRQPDGPLPIEHIANLAAFVSPTALDRLIERLDHPAALGDHLPDLAPFLSEAALKRAVSETQGRLTAAAMLDVAPFLDEETMDAILTKGARK